MLFLLNSEAISLLELLPAPIPLLLVIGVWCSVIEIGYSDKYKAVTGAVSDIGLESIYVVTECLQVERARLRSTFESWSNSELNSSTLFDSESEKMNDEADSKRNVDNGKDKADDSSNQTPHGNFLKFRHAILLPVLAGLQLKLLDMVGTVTNTGTNSMLSSQPEPVLEVDAYSKSESNSNIHPRTLSVLMCLLKVMINLSVFSGLCGIYSVYHRGMPWLLYSLLGVTFEYSTRWSLYFSDKKLYVPLPTKLTGLLLVPDESEVQENAKHFLEVPLPELQAGIFSAFIMACGNGYMGEVGWSGLTFRNFSAFLLAARALGLSPRDPLWFSNLEPESKCRLRFNSFFQATVVLIGFVVYDVYFVYFAASAKESDTDSENLSVSVMANVAKVTSESGLPLSIILKQDPDTCLPVEMLGLGDLVLPGLLLELCLRYDSHKSKNISQISTVMSTGTFSVAKFAYIMSMLCCWLVGKGIGQPQPALLYIVPFMLGSILVWKLRQK